MKLLAELRRRNVIRMAGLYLVGAWLMVQVAETLLPIFGTPDWVLKAVVVLLAIGFVPTLVFSWLYELTPDGLKRDAEVTPAQSIAAHTGRRMDRVLIAVLALAVAWFAFDKYGPAPRDGANAPADTARGGPDAPKVAAADGTAGTADPVPAVPTSAAGSVAVLPFVALSSGPDDGYFADGLSEEIINSLTSLPDLLVTARTSAFHFKGKDTPIPEIARILGVEHVLEGSVRRAGDQVRITAQLIRAADGFHLWSQTYDRSLSDVFAAQADIAENVASTLGVLLDERKRKLMADAGVGDIEAFLAYSRGRELYERAHGDEPTIPTLMRANREYEAALAIKPDFAQAYLEHSDLYAHVLMDELASDAGATSVTGLTVDEARRLLAEDLAASVRHEKGPGMRMVAQTVQTILSDNWSGLAGQLDQLLAQQLACRQWLWIGSTSMVFGRDGVYLERALERTRCNPLDVLYWVAAARSETLRGNSEGALALIDRAQDLLGARPQLTDAQVTALIALQRFDALRVLFATVPAEPVTLAHVKVAAASADRDAARKVANAFLATEPSIDREIAALALVGDREAANALTARIDASPLGAATLTRATDACTCGAPFDIAATPRFAQRVAEAGFPWPPKSPVDWPLKDW